MRVHNFNAGPAALPLAVLEQAQRDLVDHRGAGLSVLEMSHRGGAYEEIHRRAVECVGRLLGVAEGTSVLLLQGGASLQFAMVPLNLLGHGASADYVVTGAWSQKAVAEAQRVAGTRKASLRLVASGEADGFRRVPRPDELDLDPDAAYVHVTSNNTIYGTQWRELPDTGGAPLVVDASSDVLSRPLPMDRVGLLYAGAQKNLGPAGVTLVAVRDDLLDRAPESLPAILRYRTHQEQSSLYNTPPTFAIHLLGLVVGWIEAQGGVEAIEAANERKAALLYDTLDGSDFFRGHAEPASRSRMNVTFRLPDEELEKRFLAEAAEAGMIGLKGHRSVGGLRASLYNAVPLESVEALVELLRDFARRNG
ncbi:MAG TPA: 3-phosphoserine/phosphohydroxythreonine transaminase [Thermoanaerobaculia bacterium]|nr:3-phosphoserine/phosphohydroxythreonine transaminase [Thermoanaerobaculia bacterium]